MTWNNQSNNPAILQFGERIGLLGLLTLVQLTVIYKTVRDAKGCSTVKSSWSGWSTLELHARLSESCLVEDPPLLGS